MPSFVIERFSVCKQSAEFEGDDIADALAQHQADNPNTIGTNEVMVLGTRVTDDHGNVVHNTLKGLNLYFNEQEEEG